MKGGKQARGIARSCHVVRRVLLACLANSSSRFTSFKLLANKARRSFLHLVTNEDPDNLKFSSSRSATIRQQTDRRSYSRSTVRTVDSDIISCYIVFIRYGIIEYLCILCHVGRLTISLSGTNDFRN